MYQADPEAFILRRPRHFAGGRQRAGTHGGRKRAGTHRAHGAAAARALSGEEAEAAGGMAS
eukprot:790046-Prymnesium_polylepis.1